MKISKILSILALSSLSISSITIPFSLVSCNSDQNNESDSSNNLLNNTLEIKSDDDLNNLVEGNIYSLYSKINTNVTNISYEWIINPSSGLTLLNSKYDSYISFSADIAETYNITLNAYDQNNNLVVSSTKTIIINSASPIPPSTQYNIEVIQNSEHIYVNNTYSYSINVTPKGNYYYEYEASDQSLNLINNNNTFTITPNTIGLYNVNINIYDNSLKTHKLVSKTISINVEQQTQSINISWTNFNKCNNLNQTYELTATVDGNVSTPYYEWVCSNPLLQLSNINSQTVSYTCTKAGNYDLYLYLYTDSSKSKLLASKVAYLSFNELITPTENDLLISNIKKPKGYGEWFTQSSKFEEEFNKYGVLNTFGLTVYSYLKSEMLNRNFSNVYYQLTQNDDYNVIEYKIFGIANDNITDFAYNIPISVIKEGTNGYNVNKNDKVEIIFKYTRTSGGNFSTNNFDYSAINLNGIVSTDATINWGDSIGNIASKNLFYTTSWSTNAIIKVNGIIINKAYNQNEYRSVFIFAHKDDRGNNYLDTKWSIRWN